MLAKIACVRGSREVFDDGTIMPNRTGAASMISDKPVACNHAAEDGGSLPRGPSSDTSFVFILMLTTGVE
jgi:hypothetical protein